MKISFSLKDYALCTHNLSTPEDLRAFAEGRRTLDCSVPLAKAKHIPMMQARRMTLGDRALVDLGLEFCAKHPDIDYMISSSRHGELWHNYTILDAICKETEVSPTAFTMSVHNAAIGTLAIAAKSHVPSSAISHGADSFFEALLEAALLLHKGYSNILLIDYESTIPEYYQELLPEKSFPYALALLIGPGEDITLDLQPKTNAPAAPDSEEVLVPGFADVASLRFIKAFLQKRIQCTVHGHRYAAMFQQTLADL